MKVTIIDGQGGKMGKLLIEQIINAEINCEITAVGTNSIATSVMLKAGAGSGATGDNAVIVACRNADIIVGPVGIVVADSLLGEISPAMAVAVGQSKAKKLLIPVNLCNNTIVGTASLSLSRLISEAVEHLGKLVSNRINANNYYV